MNDRTRTARQTLRHRAAATRATQRAHRQIATHTPQTARTHLVAAGIDDTTARRFAGAFSRGVIADATRTAKVKLTGRRFRRVQVKLYNADTFAARLAVYLPKDCTAAALFERAAHALAA